MRDHTPFKKIRHWARSALCGSAGDAHRWIKKPEQASAFDDDLVLAQDCAPLVLLESKQKEWEKFWVPPNHTRRKLVDTLERLRRRAQSLEHSLFPVTTQEVVLAARRLKPTRATGADHFSPPEFLALPREAHDELAALFGEIETLGLLPVQTGVNIVSLIPKPAGVERPITLTPFVYFLWAALRRPSGCGMGWEKAAGFWDDCIRGSNALRAGLARRLFDELAFEHKEAHFSIYWDLTKFFDHVDLNCLVLLREHLGFPLKVLSLALNVHCNLRLLVHKGVTVSGISATRGILAGCPFSISFARACLYDILHAVHARAVRPLRLRQYVNDLAQSSTGPQLVAFEEAYETASALFNRLVDACFVISDKTTLVGSSTTYLEKLGVALRNRGIPVRTAKSVKDLGLDTTAGTR